MSKKHNMILFNIKELEKYIKLSKSSIYKMVMRREIPFIKATGTLLFNQDEIDQWLVIFSSLKNYLFISLCYRDFSNTSIEILKKFFCH